MVECAKGTQNAEKIIALEKRADTNDKDHHNFTETIKDIRDRLLGRPTWSVVFLMMALSSLCCSLIVRIVSM